MKIEVRGREVLVTDGLREHVERRVRFAFARFAPRVRSATVRLGDANGPRGGADKTCRIPVKLPPFQPIVIEDAYNNLHVAIDRAAARAGRASGRELSRRGGRLSAAADSNGGLR